MLYAGVLNKRCLLTIFIYICLSLFLLISVCLSCYLYVFVYHVTSLVFVWGWSGGAKVSCILCHRGVQLILANSWARPAILVVDKGRGGMFLFLLFLPFHSCSSFFPVLLFHLFYYLFYLFSPILWEMTQNHRVDVLLNPNTINH